MRVDAALRCGVEARFHLAEVGCVEPVGVEAVGCVEGVVGFLHGGDVGVVEGYGDECDGLVVVLDAGFVFECLGEVGVHAERRCGEVAEWAGDAGALQWVESAGVVAGCLGCDAVAFDDGGGDACLGEVVCGGTAHCARRR